VHFEHLFTGVNGMANGGVNVRDSWSAIPSSSLIFAPFVNGQTPPAMSPHPQFTDSFSQDHFAFRLQPSAFVEAPAVHRVVLIAGIDVADKSPKWQSWSNRKNAAYGP
jgi:hypothetical protein